MIEGYTVLLKKMGYFFVCVFFNVSVCLKEGQLIEESLFTRYICDAMRDLVLYTIYKKREKHSWRHITFSYRL